MTEAPVRLIDAGTVPWLRSQALYHGLAHAHGDGSPDTIVLATPAEAYVCVGLHQDPERELDLARCRALGLPVLRRQTGGGAVYLDERQLFVQWIMAPRHLPRRVEQRFERFCAPLVETYRALGVDAAFRPPNDVHAGDRKISGTGAAQIGDAEVLTGNFLFDFDTVRMAEIVRAPSQAFRTQVRQSLARYLTSLRAELGEAPPRALVAQRYVERCTATLGRELRPGALAADELDAVARLERELVDERFFAQPGGLLRPGLKIHADVYVVEREPQLPEGRFRVTARLRHGRLEAIDLAVAQAQPGSSPPPLAELERALLGVALQPAPLRAALDAVAAGRLDVAAWSRALQTLAEPPGPGS